MILLFFLYLKFDTLFVILYVLSLYQDRNNSNVEIWIATQVINSWDFSTSYYLESTHNNCSGLNFVSLCRYNWSDKTKMILTGWDMTLDLVFLISLHLTKYNILFFFLNCQKQVLFKIPNKYWAYGQLERGINWT